MNEHDEHEDFDGDLRRMFADVEDRLDVPVRPDADERIVAGARRLRRRRVAVAAAGVFVVAALAGAGIVFAVPGQDSLPTATSSTGPTPSATWSRSSSPPPSSGPTSPPGTGGPAPEGGPDGTGGGDTAEDDGDDTTGTKEEPAPPAVTGTLIGPDGLGPVRLGMSYDELVANGTVDPDAPAPAGPDCTSYGFTAGGAEASALLTAEGGVQAILTVEPTRTPEGVSTGWDIDQVRAVYPRATRRALTDTNPVHVPVAGNPGAVYSLMFVGPGPGDGFALVEIALQYADQPCIPY